MIISLLFSYWRWWYHSTLWKARRRLTHGKIEFPPNISGKIFKNLNHWAQYKVKKAKTKGRMLVYAHAHLPNLKMTSGHLTCQRTGPLAMNKTLTNFFWPNWFNVSKSFICNFLLIQFTDLKKKEKKKNCLTRYTVMCNC